MHCCYLAKTTEERPAETHTETEAGDAGLFLGYQAYVLSFTSHKDNLLFGLVFRDSDQFFWPLSSWLGHGHDHSHVITLL